MKIEILEERENPLLNRKEIRFRVEYKGKTPAFEEMRNELIKAVSSDKKFTVVDSVNSEFGSQTALGYAKVYKDGESMKVEPEHRIKKNLEGKKRKEKPAEAKAEKKEAEKPAEAEEKPKEESEPKAEKPAEPKTESQPEDNKEEPKPEAESKAEEKPEKPKAEEAKAEEKAEKPSEEKAEPKQEDKSKKEG